MRLATSKALLPVLAAVGWLGCGQSAHAQAPSDVATALRKRIWYEDFGSSGSLIVGRLYVFGPTARAGGWYTGEYVTFRGSVSAAPRLGMAWKPITNGVIIDMGSYRETLTFTGSNTQLEAFGFVGSSGRRGVLASTRSSLTPAAIRRLYYY